jgi:high-affinity iron transporter
MRLALITGLMAALLLAVAAVARAATGEAGPQRALEEVRQARIGVASAVRAAERGQRERGYELARSAYLDHFELAEIPLRLRDPNLVLETEFVFAELRNGIRDGEPVSETRATAAKLRASLDRVDRTLADPGFAAPLLAFGFSFSILFREGIEAVLLVAILLGSLEAGRASNFRRPLAWGVLAALAATVVTWLLATLVIDIAPLERELLEAVTALVAAAVLVAVSFWLVARFEHQRWMEFMRARVSSAIATGSAFAFAGLGFTAVYREGFETVLFYQALLLFAHGLTSWVVLGIAAAAVALAGVGYAILRAGRRLPLRPMLLCGASVLLVLSVTFAGNAVRSLQEGDWLPVSPVAGDWARLPVFLAELTGIHPTVEGLGVQAVLLGLYILGAVYVFAWRPLRRRRAARIATA